MLFVYLILGVLLAVWIYLVYLLIAVRKKKTDIAERRYKMLKTFLLVATISFPVGIVGAILDITRLFGIRESVIDIIVLSALGVFGIATIGSLVLFFKGR